MSRFRKMLAAASAVFALAAGVAAADFLPADPSANIPPVPAQPSDCATAPTGPVCEAAGLAALNHARDVMQLPHYQVPSDFLTEPGNQQAFIIIDDDRTTLGEQPVVGLNASVDATAQQALQAPPDPAHNNADPDPGPSSGFGNAFWRSNVGWNYPNALYAVYDWIYNDGTGSGNASCNPTQNGCWGHRHNVLAFSDSPNNIMGFAIGRDTLNRVTYEMEIVEAPPGQQLEYTWAQAQASGAGPAGPAPPTTTSSAPPTTAASSSGGGGGGGAATTTTATTTALSTTPTGTTATTTTAKPVVVKFPLMLTKVGQGSVTVRPASPDHKFVSGVSVSLYVARTALTLTAGGKPGWRFDHWSGACTSHQPVCHVTMRNLRNVKATFVPVVPKAKKK